MIRPDQSWVARRRLIHRLAAVTIASAWIWHGIVPKLAGPHPDELGLLMALGVSAGGARQGVLALGVAELAFGLVFLPQAHRRWPWLLTIALSLATLIVTVVASPAAVRAPFDPVTIKLSLTALAVIGLLTLEDA